MYFILCGFPCGRQTVKLPIQSTDQCSGDSLSAKDLSFYSENTRLLELPSERSFLLTLLFYNNIYSIYYI